MAKNSIDQQTLKVSLVRDTIEKLTKIMDEIDIYSNLIGGVKDSRSFRIYGQRSNSFDFSDVDKEQSEIVSKVKNVIIDSYSEKLVELEKELDKYLIVYDNRNIR